ncbi:UvrD-helicase domain-containing protein [Myxococcus xanthus]|uniref:UvrD-helicase domain-containing protein n=1 Tax=Myxococcus xanthus TaxID=34 RepID=UPI001CED7137|nr:ATP-dependent helicase [Myxococcus xanthus]
MSRALDHNPGQKQAYESRNHCVVLAGPGSGKTKTLTLKMARMLAEDVKEPRGIACITYNNECARELRRRLQALGVDVSSRVFIGTVHSFSLRRIILPYARYSPFQLPDPIRVAGREEKRGAVERAYSKTYGDGGDPHRQWFFAEKHRRSVLNRKSASWKAGNPQRAKFIEEYERDLHERGFIDFDDMPLIGLRLLESLPWLPPAIEAKYPILLVDEYQDLGFALDAMVKLLCFSHNVRLLAVGDADQSIYRFLGAEPELLTQLANRADVEKVQLDFNYRCGSKIITASHAALGEERKYRGLDGASEGEVFFHSRHEDHSIQAEWVLENLIPAIVSRQSIPLNQVAVLYRDARLGQHIANAADARDIGYIRADRDALYPQGSRLIRWIEDCALWTCGGWREGNPSFQHLLAEGCGLLFEQPPDHSERRIFEQKLIGFMSTGHPTKDNHDLNFGDWLTGFHREILSDYIAHVPSISDELELLEQLQERVGVTGSHEKTTLGGFCGADAQDDRLVLSTLHSAKGREFSTVVLFGIDNGILPWRNETGDALAEARRLFYVGLTRAEREVHLVCSADSVSPFAKEVYRRLKTK